MSDDKEGGINSVDPKKQLPERHLLSDEEMRTRIQYLYDSQVNYSPMSPAFKTFLGVVGTTGVVMIVGAFGRGFIRVLKGDSRGASMLGKRVLLQGTLAITIAGSIGLWNFFNKFSADSASKKL